ncbi:hypothetical protein HG531_013310 [Fusarium graminearum]|nr:hypothetical protein HG531_013310 [Fusarium graminearum]
MSDRASSRWLHTRAISSLEATFSASSRRIAALILSTSCTEGPAPTVETEIMSCAIFRGEEGSPSSRSSRSGGGDAARGDSLGGSKGEKGGGGGIMGPVVDKALGRGG